MIPAKRPLPASRAVNRVPPKAKRMTKGRWILLAAVLLLAGLGVAWASGHLGPDSRFAEIAELRERMADVSLPEKDRQALGDELRKKSQELYADVQRKAFQDMAAPMMRMMTQHMAEVLALPPEKQTAELDKDIDRMLAMTRMPEQKPGSKGPAAGSGGGPGPPRGFGGPPVTDAQRNAFRNQMLSSIPAGTRAVMGGFMHLLQSRAAQRGITMPQFGSW